MTQRSCEYVLRLRSLAVLCCLFIVAPVHAEPFAVKWSHPAWATPSQAFEGEATLDVPSNTRVTCQYAYSGGSKGEIPCTPNEGDGGAYRFSIPAEPGTDADKLSFWLEVSGADGQTHASERVTVPRSQELDIEVSGKTDEELTFPLDDWEAELLFRPCCLIVSGWIAAERIPVLPTPTAEGLPGVILSPYFRIDPDQLVEATGGLYVRVSYGDPGKAGVDPASIRPYQWRDNRWTTVFDPVFDGENQTVKFHFATGGLFVIAGNLSD